MRSRTFLLIAMLAFLVAVTGSDLFARIVIGQSAPMGALHDHFKWVRESLVGLLFLFAPFPFVALAGAIAYERARPRSAATIFAIALLALFYFYFDAFQAAEHALINGQWTASALLLGLLPIVVGIPTVVLTAAAAALAIAFDRRPSA